MRTASVVPVQHAYIDQLSMLNVKPATAYLFLTKYVAMKEGDWLIQSAGNSVVASRPKARDVKVASVVRRDTAVADASEADGTAILYGNMSGQDARLSDAEVIFNDVTVRGFCLVHWFNSATAAIRSTRARTCWRGNWVGETIYSNMDSVLQISR